MSEFRRITIMDDDHKCRTAIYDNMMYCDLKHDYCRKCRTCGIEYHVIKVLPKK